MSILAEGMRANDLEGLVLPLISIDEWASKVDDTAIVFAFYVSDQSAAMDMNRYLQKSPIDSLDTDISPAPDTRGYYLVFVELLNDDRCAENLMSVTKDLSPLTSIQRWQMRLRGKADIMPLDGDKIAKYLAKLRRDARAGIVEYLVPSKLADARLDERQLTLRAAGEVAAMEVIDFGPMRSVLLKHDLEAAPLSLDGYANWQGSKVRRLLGENWDVYGIGDYHVIQRQGCESVLLARL